MMKQSESDSSFFPPNDDKIQYQDISDKILLQPIIIELSKEL
jgi:hypothetical protein